NDVVAEHALPLVDRLLEEGLYGIGVAGIGEEYFESAKLTRAALDRGGDAGLVARIRHVVEACSAGLGDERRRLLQRLLATADHHHGRTFPGEPQRTGPAHAAAASGDNGTTS